MTMLGGIHELPINDQNSLEIDGLARFAVEEHKKKENVLLEFVRVVRARQQVVAGTMYYITLEATDGEKNRIYEAQIWEQPWINFKELQEFKPTDQEEEEEVTMLGGIDELLDCENNLEIDGLARFAIDQYNKKENKLLEFVKIVNVKHQVVAGSIYYITLEATEGGQKKIYEATVWDKPWMNFKELQEFKPIENEKEGMPVVPGGIHELPHGENNLEVIDLARFAVDQHNKNENVLLEYGKVVKAKEQKVAGTIYYITLEAKDGGKKKIYEAKIWVKPWMNFKELLEFKLTDDAPSASEPNA